MEDIKSCYNHKGIKIYETFGKNDWRLNKIKYLPFKILIPKSIYEDNIWKYIEKSKHLHIAFIDLSKKVW